MLFLLIAIVIGFLIGCVTDRFFVAQDEKRYARDAQRFSTWVDNASLWTAMTDEQLDAFYARRDGITC